MNKNKMQINFLTLVLLVYFSETVTFFIEAKTFDQSNGNNEIVERRQHKLVTRSKMYFKKSFELESEAREPEFETSVSAVSESFNSIPARRSNNLQLSDNVTTILGHNALLPCSVRNIDSFKILWLRVKDGDVLAYDNLLISQDPRFSLIQSTPKESNLFIKSVKESDSGEYACQLNTNSLKVKFVNLVILSKHFN
jgi:hypothetical protein